MWTGWLILWPCCKFQMDWAKTIWTTWSGTSKQIETCFTDITLTSGLIRLYIYMNPLYITYKCSVLKLIPHTLIVFQFLTKNHCTSIWEYIHFKHDSFWLSSSRYGPYSHVWWELHQHIMYLKSITMASKIHKKITCML